MKAITVRQPWASLIAAGVKTIETRPRPTRYRGRIAIHAGLHRPPLMHLPPLSRRRNDPADRQTWLVIDTITDPAFHGPQPTGRRIPKRATTPTLFYPHAGPNSRPWDETAGTSATEQESAILLPLGAVVASAMLTDCLPIERHCTERAAHPGEDVLLVAEDGHGLLLDRWNENIQHDHTDQLPFGDFSPGRWALLLDDIAPTTDRCPACWACDLCGGIEFVPWPEDPAHRMCTTCFHVCAHSPCRICGGAGRCDPVPARGQRAVPWEWTPQPEAAS